MSPAMVDFRSSAAAAAAPSSQALPKRHPRRNPRRGEIPNPSSSPLPSSDQIRSPPPATNPSMDPTSLGRGASGVRNPSEPNMDSACATLFTSPKVEKPLQASGLSKPRFSKVRRHLASARVKPPPQETASAVPKSGDDLGFNPFRSGPPAAAAPNQGETQVLRERFYSWTPFNSVGGVGAAERTNGSSSSSFNSAKSENVGFVFGRGSNSDSKEGGVGAAKDGAFTFSSSGSGNLGSFESMKPETAGFVFGSGQSSSSASNLNSRNSGPGDRKNADSSFAAVGSQNPDLGSIPDAGVFAFESGVKKCSNFDQSCCAGFDESVSSRLPDEMRKLNIEGSGNGDGLGKTDDSSKVDEKKTFVFGSSQNVNGSFGGNTVDKLPEGMKKLNIGSRTTSQNRKEENMGFGTGVFMFGSSSEKSDVSDRSTADGFDKSTANKLPDEMQKLNIRVSENNSSFEKIEIVDNSSKANDSTAFVFGSSKSASGSFGESDSTTCGLVFGSSLKKSTISDRTTADGFDKSTLPDWMQELNIRGSVNNNSFEKTEGGDHRSNTNDSSASAFGGSKNVTGSFGENDSTTGISTPLQFPFHTREKDTSSGAGAVPPVPPHYYVRPTEAANVSSGPSSLNPSFQPPVNDFTFTSAREGLGTSQMDFSTPKQDASWSSKQNFVPPLHQNLTFSVKKGVVNDSRSRKRRGKLRDSSRNPQKGGKGFLSSGKSSLVNSELESPGSYSPMDFSPCQMESLVSEEYSGEASLASDESVPFDSRHTSTDTQESISMDAREEDLVSSTQHLDINEDDLKCGELNDETSVAAESSFEEELVSGLGHNFFTSKTVEVGGKHDSGDAATETRTGFSSSDIEKQASDDGREFTFAFCSDGIRESNFMFAASPSTQGPLSASKRHYRRKYWTKVSQDSYISTPDAKVHLSSTTQFIPHVNGALRPDSTEGLQGVSFVSQSVENRLEANKRPEVRQESSSMATVSVAAQEACEKWRLRGNQAYANGDLSKAEENYTRGVKCVSPNETSRSCTRALMLCYSNRAATRMSLGRMREALNDCMMAAAIDPNFLRAQLRAANCHLALGETEDASNHFKKCLPSGNELCLDRKIVLDASDGLQKAQQVADYMDRSAVLLRKRTPTDATTALQIISDALSISSLSESLTEMKAESLLMLRRYEEVIQLCDETLVSAKKNSVLTSSDDQLKDVDSLARIQSYHASLWRWRLKSKSYFHLGRFEEALNSLLEHEQVGPIIEKYLDSLLEHEQLGPIIEKIKSSESLAAFTAMVRELLRLKVAGNAAFIAGRHLEAVEHYTAALAHNVESRPFAAVCFCNRAAAYQALGQITDAIADCSLAIALDANYPKAISRRATLHEMIRDYGQATNDIHRLISLLEKKLDSQSGALGRSTSNGDDLELVRSRLAKVEEKARKGIPLDMYLILGIESSSDAADIKKAYRKAALRHHPDKAGQFLARSESSDDGLWKEVADEVHRDADRLFKMIGEAYTVLTDTSKRLQYDAEEEMRTFQKKGNNGSGTPKTPADSQSGHFERSSNRWQSRDSWKSYGSPNQRRSDYSRSGRYF